MSCRKAYRQGEILFVPMNNETVQAHLDKNKLTLKSDGIIREGEQTGHMHTVVGGTLQENKGFQPFNRWDNTPEMLVQASNGASVTHPEHATLTLPNGNYEVIIQREYDEEQDIRVRD